MKKIGRGLALALTILLTACSRQTAQESVSAALDLDASAGEVLFREDDHRGFHGDGTTLIELHFTDEEVLDQIRESAEWKTFPLDETVQALVYGVTRTHENGSVTESVGPYLTDEDGGPLVPEIRKGYYRLIDHQAEQRKATGADILHRASFNFTLGLYDTEKDILYFCEMDT